LQGDAGGLKDAADLAGDGGAGGDALAVLLDRGLLQAVEMSGFNRLTRRRPMCVFIGLDVSLAKTAICVVDRDGAVQWQGKVPSEPGPLVKRLAEWSGDIELAGIEACPLSEWLHRELREAGIPVVCIETRHAQRFLSSRLVKSDKNDARGIAEMMRLGHYRPVHVKSPAAQSMRTTLAVRMQLVASQLQVEGTIRGLLKKIGAIHRNRFAARVIELLELAALPELTAAIQPLLRVREGMRVEQKALDRTLAALSRRDDVTRRLMTIPGVGPTGRYTSNRRRRSRCAQLLPCGCSSSPRSCKYPRGRPRCPCRARPAVLSKNSL
jgi:transposase